MGSAFLSSLSLAFRSLTSNHKTLCAPRGAGLPYLVGGRAGSVQEPHNML